jgi:hypothetical protein
MLINSLDFLHSMKDNLKGRCLHCKEHPIYVLPEIKLRGLSPNFNIHISENDLYIPTIGPPIFLQQNRQTNRGDIYVPLTELSAD